MDISTQRESLLKSAEQIPVRFFFGSEGHNYVQIRGLIQKLNKTNSFYWELVSWIISTQRETLCNLCLPSNSWKTTQARPLIVHSHQHIKDKNNRDNFSQGKMALEMHVALRIVVHCFPLLSIVVHCCPLFSIVVNCLNTAPYVLIETQLCSEEFFGKINHC